jgi:4-amino-4-deoxy-L-arabinose transferase-like glycosyltransferase
MDDQRWWWVAVVPLIVAALLYLPGIGSRVIYIGDEARYALLARNMVETGDWLVPRIGAEVHLEKSPLFVWAIAAFSLAGRRVTEFTAVLPSALSGIAGVGATWLLARQLFGARAALLSAFVLVTAWGYFWHARMALADMMVTFFAIGAAAAFATVVTTGRSRRLPIAIAWACLGLGLAAKGPIALMPMLAFAAFLVAEHGWRGLGKLRPLLGVVVFALVSLPWAIGFFVHSGQSYVQSVIVGDYIAPRIHGWDSAVELFFAAGPIGIGFLPWTVFLPAALMAGWWRAREPGLRRAFRFLLFWVITYVVVITALPHKRDRYLLATYPMLAIMVGWLWDRWMACALAPRLRVYAGVWAAVAAVAAAVVLSPPRVRTEVLALLPPTLGGRLVLVGLFGATAVLVIVAAQRRHVLATFAAICAPMILVLAYETRVYVAGHNRMFDIKGFAERLASRTDARDRLMTYRYQHLALEFYTGRPVIRATSPGQLRSLVSDGRPVYVIADDRGWPTVREATGQAWGVVDQAVIAGRPLIVAVPGRP